MRDFGKDDKAIINGRQVYGANIADIVPIDKYYEENPKELPTPKYKQLEAPIEKPLTRERYLHSARSTLKGLRQYIDGSSNPTPTALLIAKNLAKKIKDANEGVGSFAKSQIELINQLT